MPDKAEQFCIAINADACTVYIFNILFNATTASEKIYRAALDVFSIVSIRHKVIIAAVVFKDQSLHDGTVNRISFQQLPVFTVLKIRADAEGATPIQIVIGILPIANFCRHGNNVLVFVITEGNEYVDGFGIAVEIMTGSSFGKVQNFAKAFCFIL